MQEALRGWEAAKRWVGGWVGASAGQGWSIPQLWRRQQVLGQAKRRQAGRQAASSAEGVQRAGWPLGALCSELPMRPLPCGVFRRWDTLGITQQVADGSYNWSCS